MDNNSTLNDLTLFYQQEKQLLKEIFVAKKETTKLSDECLRNIQNYSKVLSTRKTKTIGTVEFVLN